MRNFFYLFTVVLSTIAIIIAGCEKEIDTSPNIDDNKTKAEDKLVVKNGMLSFSSQKLFEETREMITHMSEDELNIWEADLGFMSLRTKQNKVLDELDMVDTDEEVYSILSENPNLFQIVEDRNQEPELAEIVDDKVYTALADINGMYVVENTTYKVLKDVVLVADNENYEQLLKVNDNNFDEYKNESWLKIIEDEPNNRLKSSCSECGVTDITVDVIKNKSWCKNDRKVKLTAKVDGKQYDFPTEYKIKATITVRGYRKRGCVWVIYKTDLYYEDVAMQVYTSQGTFSFNFPDGYKSDTRKLEKTETVATISGGYQGVYNFKDIYASASSRGVGNRWAIIDCPKGPQ